MCTVLSRPYSLDFSTVVYFLGQVTSLQNFNNVLLLGILVVVMDTIHVM